MAVIVGQTREELRKSIGHNLGAIRVGTMTGSGSTSTGVDAEMPNADDHENGNHIVFTSGTNDGSIRIQTSYVGSSNTFTTRGDALAASTADGDTYESWDEDMPPARPRHARPGCTDDHSQGCASVYRHQFAHLQGSQELRVPNRAL